MPPSGALEARRPPPDAVLVRARLTTWFAQNARDLPWRRPDCTPWGVLVSEVMSQQTPLARVEPIWREWMERWPTPEEAAAASPADILRVWGTLGYPRRALRLQECARQVAAGDGEVPRTEAELLALPGVGTYTAAAVLAFAFGRRSVVVDTNVRRILARIFEGTALAGPHVTAAQMRLAAEVAPTDDAASALWAVSSIEFGALVCSARAPACGRCPVADLCSWRAAGFPPDEHAARRRPQAWSGTDRQVRGRIMAVLRTAPETVPRSALDLVWSDPVQLERCVKGLLTDALIEEQDDGLRLPR